MNILKRDIAPISSEAWDEINEQARKSLTSHLVARKVVDVDGPKGWKFGGVALGRVKYAQEQTTGDVVYGLHQFQPLVEIRRPFSLSRKELENISRGARDVDLEPLEKAAEEVARFEENAIYYGFEPGCIRGLKDSSDFETKAYPKVADDILGVVAQGISEMRQASVEGPYSLITNPKRWGELARYSKGYPLRRQLVDLLGGSIHVCPGIEETFLVSERGGDFILTVGQDLSIGYDSTVGDEINLFFTESFTFRVVDPAALIVFK